MIALDVLPPHINRHVVITGMVQNEAVRPGSQPSDCLSTEDMHCIGHDIANALDDHPVNMAQVHDLVRERVHGALHERAAAIARH